MNRMIMAFIVTFLMIPSICAQSVLLDGFDSVELTPEEKTAMWRNLELNVIDPQNTQKEILEQSILGFDISESGIVVALESNRLAILDREGNVHTCFRFQSSGDYGVHWNDHNILLFQIRSSLVYEFTADGQYVEIKQLNEHAWKTSALRNEIIKRKSILSVMIQCSLGVFFRCFVL